MGKIHGSITKPGKVKKSTPKVPKKVKRKEPRGRAKRRLQYNKRVLNKTKVGNKMVAK